MNQSLNLVQDLEFTEVAESAATVVGGLVIGRLPIDCDWGGCFPRPRPPIHIPRPTHPPINWTPTHGPFVIPKHPPTSILAAETTAAAM
jgi:hypothetical protein